MKKLFRIVLAILLLTQSAFATDYYVDFSKSDDSGDGTSPSTAKKNIHAGEALLSCGDTLWIAGGTYTGGSYIGLKGGDSLNQQCTGFGANGITIRNYAGQRVLIQPDMTVRRGIDFTKESTGDVNRYWKVIADARDNIAVDCTDCFIDADAGAMAFSENNFYVWIENVELFNNPAFGFEGHINHGTFINLNVHDNGTFGQPTPNHGVYVWGSNNLFDGGIYHHNNGYGIHFFFTSHDSGDDNIFRNLKVYDNNLTFDNGGGVLLASGHRNIIYNSQIYGNGFTGLAFDFNCNDCAGYGNTIYGNTGLGVFTGDPRVGSYGATGTAVKNNIMFSNSGGPSSFLGPSTDATNNFTGDPSFMNAGSGDFTLQSGSVARASNGFVGWDPTSTCTGLNVALCSDRIGVARGTTPDAGSDQFAAGTPGNVSSISPDNGTQGSSVSITVTGASTNFSNGVSVCSFSGSGIVVTSTPVSSSTSLTCNATIDHNAAVGARDITITTGAEVVTATGAFTVVTLNSRQIQLFRIN